MRRSLVGVTLRYAGAALTWVAVGTAASWPLLDEVQRTGVLIAAAVALPVQVVAFALLLRFREPVNRFLAVWAGGTVLRFGVVLGVGAVAYRSDGLPGAAVLLALVGFFFGMLLMEPVFFRRVVS